MAIINHRNFTRNDFKAACAANFPKVESSLKQRIDEQEKIVREVEKLLQLAKTALNELYAARVNCEHSFSNPMPGLENEGGYCVHCGMNEIHAATIKGKQ